MSKWKGQSKGTALGYKIFIFLLKNFGLKPAYLLLRFVSGYYFLFSKDTNKVIKSYFSKQHGFSSSQTLKLLYKNYYLLGQSIIDKVAVMAGFSQSFTFECEGVENIHELVNAKKGGILLSAHIGNYEIAGHFLKDIDCVFNIVMFDGELEKIKSLIDNTIGGRKINVITIKENLAHIYEISERLSNGEIICLHGDRYLENMKTIDMPFMNGIAKFPIGPFQLINTFKVPFLYAYGFKESDTHYHFYAFKPGITTFERGEQAIKNLCQDFLKNVEMMVKKYPAHWFNYHEFWNQ